MPRPPRANRDTIVDSMLTVRLSRDDRDLLEQLVELRSKELVGEGLEPTAASYLRGLIRREAAAKGLRARRARPAATNGARADAAGRPARRRA